MKNYSQEELFISLVNQFKQSALIYLGKIKNPQNNKFEKNNTLADYFIAMLKMLQEKTKNNLSINEEKSMSQIIVQLDSDFHEAGS